MTKICLLFACSKHCQNKQNISSSFGMCLEILIWFASDNFYYNEARNVVCCILIHLLIVRSTYNVPCYIICIIELRNLNECDNWGLILPYRHRHDIIVALLKEETGVKGISSNQFEFLWIYWQGKTFIEDLMINSFL